MHISTASATVTHTVVNWNMNSSSPPSEKSVPFQACYLELKESLTALEERAPSTSLGAYFSGRSHVYLSKVWHLSRTRSAWAIVTISVGLLQLPSLVQSVSAALTPHLHQAPRYTFTISIYDVNLIPDATGWYARPSGLSDSFWDGLVLDIQAPHKRNWVALMLWHSGKGYNGNRSAGSAKRDGTWLKGKSNDRELVPLAPTKGITDSL